MLFSAGAEQFSQYKMTEQNRESTIPVLKGQCTATLLCPWFNTPKSNGLITLSVSDLGIHSPVNDLII